MTDDTADQKRANATERRLKAPDQFSLRYAPKLRPLDQMRHKTTMEERRETIERFEKLLSGDLELKPPNTSPTRTAYQGMVL